ncbi:TPA: ISAs1 family transposase, partial [Klebsiella pneumoniae]
IMAAGELAAQFPHWEQLRSIGVAISYRIEKREKITIEQRYYISSKALTRDEFARSVRGHWAIENSLHWVLDVTMGEDDCPIYRGDAAEILACIRHMGLNMLRAETSRKASIRRKQKIAGMSSEYLEKVLNGGVSGNPRKFRHSALWNFLGGWSAA